LVLTSAKPTEIADPKTYLNDIKAEMKKTWPYNRTINLVFHGHSVPSGYTNTPEVRPFESYPQQVFREVKKIYPYAVINIILTSIGGETSQGGAKRFDNDVLRYKPDVLFIDYGVNDRFLSLDSSKKAMESMITKALKQNIKIILITPGPDQRLNILQNDNPLEKVSDQIKQLASHYNIGCADAYSDFKQIAMSGDTISHYMWQMNHPNEKGHHIIAAEILKYFE
jgi:acyl-CoA thioesterase-1